jgi:hypothetical protein
MRRSAFQRISVKLVSETCLLLLQKEDVHSYCASPIMQVKETRAARGASPFILKAGMSHIPHIKR